MNGERMNETSTPGMALARRHFLRDCGVGLGKIALGSLLAGVAASRVAANPLAPKQPHFPAKAKARHPPVHGRRPEPARPVRPQAGAGEARRQAAPAGGHRRPALRLHPPRRRRARPAVQVRQARPVRRRTRPRCCRTSAKVVDDICLIKSVHTDQFNHAPAQIFFNTGFSQPGRPSLGSWVDLRPGRRDAATCRRSSSCPPAAASAAARPTGRAASCRRVYTGVRFRNQGDPILNVSSPAGVDAQLQRDTLDLVGAAQPPAARRRRRPGDRHAHRHLRDGLPPADRRPRS